MPFGSFPVPNLIDFGAGKVHFLIWSAKCLSLCVVSVHVVAILSNFGHLSRFVRVQGLRGPKTQKGAMVTMVTSCFFTKVLWSRLWSRLWSLWSLRFSQKPPRPDHSDHSLTIGLTIALLLPNKRATIVTIALFWVLAPRRLGHGQNGPFGQNVPKLSKRPRGSPRVFHQSAMVTAMG